MKALTIMQPYAHLIVTGKKRLEVRTWSTDLRGDFFIHAGKKDAHPDCPPDWPRGALVAKAFLFDVRRMIPQDKQRACVDTFDPEWFVFEIWNVSPIVPIPLRGQQRFFEVPPEISNRFRLL